MDLANIRESQCQEFAPAINFAQPLTATIYYRRLKLESHLKKHQRSYPNFPANDAQQPLRYRLTMGEYGRNYVKSGNLSHCLEKVREIDEIG